MTKALRLEPGTRIRVVGGPWPQRIGCEGTVVHQPNGPGVYPDDPRSDAQGEVLILLEGDPLELPPGVFLGEFHEPDSVRGWTCRIDADSLEVAE